MTPDYSNYAFIPHHTQPDLDNEKLLEFTRNNWHNADISDPSKVGWKAYTARHFVKTETFSNRAGYKYYQHDPDCHWYWDRKFEETFPEIVAWVESLPWIKLNWCVLVSQLTDIHLHKDRTKWEDVRTIHQTIRPVEPSGYRLLIPDPADLRTRDQSFHMSPTHDPADRVYCTFPEGVTSFMMNETTHFHGATHHPGTHKTTMYITGVVEPTGHYENIRKSLEKYGDHAIQFDPVSPDAVPEYRGNWQDPNQIIQDN